MRSLSINVSSFLVATLVVMALSLGLMQIGAFGDNPGGNVVLNPTTTPAVLDSSATPQPATSP
ncbi:MAG: hypothetical protein WD904_12785 [Dehalococcoidia bacterium]